MNIRKAYIIAILFFWGTQILRAQKHKFSVEGKINGINYGTIELFPVGNSKHFRSIKIDSTDFYIQDGKFILTGKLNYPHAFYIFFKNDTVFLPTEMVFITPGRQTLNVSADSIKNSTPKITNSPANDEYLNVFLKDGYSLLLKNYNEYLLELQQLSSSFFGKIPDSIRLRMEIRGNEIKHLKHKYLCEYVLKYPNSYVPLWIAVDLFSSGGFTIELENTFKSFSPKLKKTNTAKYFQYALMKSKQVSVGQTFPYKVLEDTSGKSVSISFQNNRYTIVDFWYSNCAPCIKQFPELLSLNERYQSKGLGIIQISIDVESRRGSMIKLINQYGLNWPHYWDKNGVKSSGYFINQFPTNFLVDHKGKIVAKNLGMASLKNYLESTLNNQ